MKGTYEVFKTCELFPKCCNLGTGVDVLVGVENKTLGLAPKEAAKEGLVTTVAGGGVKRLAQLGVAVAFFLAKFKRLS